MESKVCGMIEDLQLNDQFNGASVVEKSSPLFASNEVYGDVNRQGKSVVDEDSGGDDDDELVNNHVLTEEHAAQDFDYDSDWDTYGDYAGCCKKHGLRCDNPRNVGCTPEEIEANKKSKYIREFYNDVDPFKPTLEKAEIAFDRGEITVEERDLFRACFGSFP